MFHASTLGAQRWSRPVPSTVTYTGCCTRRKYGLLLSVATAAGGGRRAGVSCRRTHCVNSVPSRDATSKQQSLTTGSHTEETLVSSGTRVTGRLFASAVTTTRQRRRTSTLFIITENKTAGLLTRPRPLTALPWSRFAPAQRCSITRSAVPATTI